MLLTAVQNSNYNKTTKQLFALALSAKTFETLETTTRQLFLYCKLIKNQLLHLLTINLKQQVNVKTILKQFQKLF